MGWQDELKAFEKDFEEAEEPDSKPILPDGDYTVEVTSSKVVTASWGEVQWEMRFGNEQGRIVKFSTLQNPRGMGWTKKDAKLLGWTGSRLVELAPWIPTVEGAMVEITVARTPKKNDASKMFINVYLNRLLKAGTGVPVEPDLSVTSDSAFDDDIPF